MQFLQEVAVQVIGAIVGTALLGTLVAIVAQRLEDIRQDRRFRLDLIRRVSSTTYAIHVNLSFYERWRRHAKPRRRELLARRNEVDDLFEKQRAAIGALQTEIDAYFGENAGPGVSLHKLTDLSMVRYALILELPETQIQELVLHLGKPGHSGYTETELRRIFQSGLSLASAPQENVRDAELKFTKAFETTIALLAKPGTINKNGGFQSRKLFTAFDERRPT